MERLIDCHAHLAALPDGQNGAFVSDRLRNGPVFRFVARAMGLSLSRPAESNRRYLERLAALVLGSRRAQAAVTLAMDGVYDATGRFDPGRTGLYVPNDLVFAACSEFRQLLPGASVNPARADARRELARVSDRGAVLLKCLPNAMLFDPADNVYRPFWRDVAKRRIPVLTHIGFEFAVTGHRQELGDPARLLPLLEEGVTVIGAHGGSSGRFFGQTYLDTVLTLASRYPNFFLDSSALTLPNRMGMLRRIGRAGSAARVLAPRLLFGTDFPLPVWTLPLWLAGRPLEAMRARRISNPFDRQADVLDRMGLVPDPTLARRVLRLPASTSGRRETRPRARRAGR